uniref:Secreted protein n=1 Tax=Heterorhabditis bacteriophora TaxID=37862 RepID=A0A1I7WMR3_HETBA
MSIISVVLCIVGGRINHLRKEEQSFCGRPSLTKGLIHHTKSYTIPFLHNSLYTSTRLHYSIFILTLPLVHFSIFPYVLHHIGLAAALLLLVDDNPSDERSVHFFRFL